MVKMWVDLRQRVPLISQLYLQFGECDKQVRLFITINSVDCKGSTNTLTRQYYHLYEDSIYTLGRPSCFKHSPMANMLGIQSLDIRNA
jgi:hypothetical protein